MKIPNEINLRQEMNEILDEYGIWVLYQRLSSKVHCNHCWNEKYKEGRSNCTYCGGTGWVSRLERRKVRKIGAAIPISEPNLTSQTELGHMLVQQYRWFMAHDVYPRAGDRIFEVLWDTKDPYKPVELVTSHFINTSSDYRADGGAIAYWEAASRTVTTNLKVENIIMRSVGRIKDYTTGG